MRAALVPMLVALAVACSKPPPPDPDGALEGARTLGTEKPIEDALACDRKTNDCADWYRVRTKGEGRLELALVLLVDPDVDAKDDEKKKPPTPEFLLELRDKEGELLSSTASEGGREVRATADIAGGPLFAVALSPGGKTGLRYRLRAAFEPAPPPPPPPEPVAPPPPPPPQFEMRSGAVLELERRAGEESVLIELGATAGIVAGLRGRLLDSGREIGVIVIQDVYPDGSRARVEGALLGQVTARTTAEIEVPREPPAPPLTPPAP